MCGFNAPTSTAHFVVDGFIDGRISTRHRANCRTHCIARTAHAAVCLIGSIEALQFVGLISLRDGLTSISAARSLSSPYVNFQATHVHGGLQGRSSTHTVERRLCCRRERAGQSLLHGNEREGGRARLETAAIRCPTLATNTIGVRLFCVSA